MWCVALFQQPRAFLIIDPDIFCTFGATVTSLRNGDVRVVHHLKALAKGHVMPFEWVRWVS